MGLYGDQLEYGFNNEDVVVAVNDDNLICLAIWKALDEDEVGRIAMREVSRLGKTIRTIKSPLNSAKRKLSRYCTEWCRAIVRRGKGDVWMMARGQSL